MTNTHKFWMVWLEGSQSVKYKHFSKVAAEREAARLARSNPGENFYVLKATSLSTAKAPKIVKIKLRQTREPDEIPF